MLICIHVLCHSTKWRLYLLVTNLLQCAFYCFYSTLAYTKLHCWHVWQWRMTMTMSIYSLLFVYCLFPNVGPCLSVFPQSDHPIEKYPRLTAVSHFPCKACLKLLLLLVAVTVANLKVCTVHHTRISYFVKLKKKKKQGITVWTSFFTCKSPASVT